MKRGFLNQKLGKRTSRRTNLQKARSIQEARHGTRGPAVPDGNRRSGKFG